MNDIPPFKAGQAAFRAGKPLDANPHREVQATGDDWPGPWQNWRMGWKTEQKMTEWDNLAKGEV